MPDTPQRQYDAALAQGIPYCGTHLGALQGSFRRHGYMRRLIQVECGRRPPGLFSMIEVGSWAGASALTWGLALQEFCQGIFRIVCIDPWEVWPTLAANPTPGGQVMREALTTNQVKSLFDHNVRVTGLADRIIPMMATSEQALPYFESESVDLIYLDGDHSYRHVSRDIQLAIPLLKPHGILCGDDLELQGSEVDLAFAHAHQDEDYPTDPRTGRGFHPGVTLALHDIGSWKRTPCYEGFWVLWWTGTALTSSPEWWTREEQGQLSRPLPLPPHIHEV